MRKDLRLYVYYVFNEIGVTFNRVTCDPSVPICLVPTLFISLQSVSDLMLKEHDGGEQ